MLDGPSQEVTAGQLRPVVAANRLRHTAFGDDRLQHPGHPSRGEAGVHLQRQALAGVRIHDAQRPNRAPALHRIVHEVQRPLLVRRRPLHQRLTRTNTVLSLLAPDHQPRRAIDPVQSLVVHPLTRPTEQHVQPAVSEARLLPRQLHQPGSQGLVAAPALVAIGSRCHQHQCAGPPLTEGVLTSHLPDSCLHRYELQPFFRITDCKASLSSDKSATSLRSRLFSSRNCLASCASLALMPPYFAFHEYSVCLLTPTSRATSSALRPASICFSAAIISASVCRLRDMLFPLFLASAKSEIILSCVWS